jgi:hypothetical protein
VVEIDGRDQQMSDQESNSSRYMHAFRDIVFELILEAKSLKGNDVVGQRIAMLHTLGHIKNQAIAFQLDLEYLGLADFDPERWFMETAQNSN